MDRQTILDEIRRTAEENDGVPLGKLRLDKEAGIKEHHWTKYWARLSEAHREAGFSPNAWIGPIDEVALISLLAALARDLGHFPTQGELLVKCNADTSWPSQSVFIKRFGSKARMVESVAAYCRGHPGCEDVLAYCLNVAKPSEKGPEKLVKEAEEAASCISSRPGASTRSARRTMPASESES